MSVPEKKQDKILLICIVLISTIVALCMIPAINPGIAGSMQTVMHEGLASGDAGFNTILDSLKYEKSIHILAMLLLGFGFLMVFVRKHGFGSITATFVVVSVAIPFYAMIKSFGQGDFGMSTINIDTLLFAEFAAASLLIAIGAPLGRLRMEQYFVMAMLFVPAYIFNEWIILESGLFSGFLDTGGSVVIHAFGAYFGLGLVATTFVRFQDAPGSETDKTSNQFCLLGGIVLWLFWPSFTSAIVAPGEVVLTSINTVFALCGATLATFAFSKLLRGKIEIEDIANASLAGGVAIGSACNMVSPGFAMLIGIAAGSLSTFGFAWIAPRVEKLIKGSDTCGVHNLHGMPGVFGGITGAMVTGNFGVQFGGILATVVLAFVLGRISGIVVGSMAQKKIPYSDEDEFIVGHDIAVDNTMLHILHASADEANLSKAKA